MSDDTDIACKPYSREDALALYNGTHELHDGRKVSGNLMTLDELVGAAMRETKGHANPQLARILLSEVRKEALQAKSGPPANKPVPATEAPATPKPILVVDTVAGSDGGDWVLWALEHWPGCHVLAYCGDLEAFCLLEGRFRGKMRYAGRLGFRCADVGVMPETVEQVPYDKHAAATMATLEHPTLLPAGFGIIRVRDAKHLEEIENCFPVPRMFGADFVDQPPFGAYFVLPPPCRADR
jgi:hypothetical protein